MKKFMVVFMMVFLFWSTAQADIKLPPPQTEGGMGLFEALKKRASAAGGDFSAAEISLENLSTVLWSASGLNRGQHGWTVPMADGLPPYCRIYVVGNGGVYMYDWKENNLIEISTDNITGEIAHQSFVKKAFYILVFVADKEALSGLRSQETAGDFSHVLVGAMTQNVYLAAASLKLGARYIHSINREAVVKGLKLPDGDEPICLMLLGK